ncbi:multidrug-efflux transporter [Lentilactobacillus buchneri subsp. silagei CD034]|uniref:Multidrug-efflux transporter n=1 Tax=Lentilactobacillus buchneri subsp. silagei CD034 TaxID=1071400 RepID=J9W0L0_LENBU|nr:MFS transporter [Lentilactobacillus buchneri]AFR99261.1 multidrug-efflux transporter [Lentilactobacillus buchneri subsp. silagei CD034]
MTFLVARMIQSVGGGGIFVIASSHVLSTYPKKAQGGLLGALGAVNGIASVVGPNLGSLILNLTGRWNWLFLINLQIAIFVIVAGWLVIPETIGSHVKSLDLKGLTILSLGIFSIMLAITNLQSGHLLVSLLTPQVWGAGLVGIGLFVGFVLVEKRIAPRFDPFLPYHLLANKGFLLTLLMGLLSGMLIAIFVFIPSFVEQVYGISANNSGIWMSGIGLGSILGAGIGGTLVSRLGATKTVIVSGGLSAAGWFLATSTLAGFGFGMLMGAQLSVLMAQFADQADNGIAFGTLSVSRQVGLTIAPTIYATIIQSGFSRLSLSTPLEEYYRILLAKAAGSHSDKLATFYQIAQQAYQHLFVVAVVISLIILAGGWILIRRRGSKNIA